MVWWICSLAAWAEEPVVSTDAAGVVRAVAIVPRSTVEVIAFVQDPLAVHAASGDGGTLKATPNAGCFDVTYQLDNVIADVRYLAKACPTATGFRSDVVESPTFEHQTAEWSVRPVAGGAEVTYVYSADLAIPVPKWLVRNRTESAIRTMIKRVAAKLGG